MSQEKPNTYTAEFRASAVKLANESDQSVAQTAKDLGINVNTLHTWIGKYSRPKESDKTVRTDEHLYTMPGYSVLKWLANGMMSS